MPRPFLPADSIPTSWPEFCTPIGICPAGRQVVDWIRVPPGVLPTSASKHARLRFAGRRALRNRCCEPPGRDSGHRRLGGALARLFRAFPFHLHRTRQAFGRDQQRPLRNGPAGDRGAGPRIQVQARRVVDEVRRHAAGVVRTAHGRAAAQGPPARSGAIARLPSRDERWRHPQAERAGSGVATAGGDRQIRARCARLPRCGSVQRAPGSRRRQPVFPSLPARCAWPDLAYGLRRAAHLAAADGARGGRLRPGHPQDLYPAQPLPGRTWNPAGDRRRAARAK